MSGNAGPAVQKLTRSASGRALWEPPQAHFPWDAAADHAQAWRTQLLGARLSVLAMSDGTELGPNRTSVARRAGRLTVWAYSVDAQEDPPGAMRKVAWPRNRLGRKPEAIPESLSVREIIKDLLRAAATGRTVRPDCPPSIVARPGLQGPLRRPVSLLHAQFQPSLRSGKWTRR